MLQVTTREEGEIDGREGEKRDGEGGLLYVPNIPHRSLEGFHNSLRICLRHCAIDIIMEIAISQHNRFSFAKHMPDFAHGSPSANKWHANRGP